MLARKLVGSLSLVLSVTSAACQSYEAGARENFSKTFTCPEERIEVRPRPDISPVDIRYPTRPQPPAEIKADPGRLKIWQAEQDQRLASAGAHCEVWEGKGCDHQTLFCCHRPAKNQNRVSCSTEKYPPGVSKY